MLMNRDNRRSFFRRIAALANASAVKGAAIRRPEAFDSSREQTAYQIRQSAALFQSEQPVADHPTNGDETSGPPYIGNFTKGLPHTQNGEVEPGAYESLLDGLATGSVTAL